MKKLLALPFKIVAAPLLTGGLVILVIGGLILNGREKTGRKIMALVNAMDIFGEIVKKDINNK